jgi:hypothetical protein
MPLHNDNTKSLAAGVDAEAIYASHNLPAIVFPSSLL